MRVDISPLTQPQYFQAQYATDEIHRYGVCRAEKVYIVVRNIMFGRIIDMGSNNIQLPPQFGWQRSSLFNCLITIQRA